MTKGIFDGEKQTSKQQDFQYLCIFLKHFMQLSFSTLYFAQFRPIFKHLHIPPGGFWLHRWGNNPVQA